MLNAFADLYLRVKKEHFQLFETISECHLAFESLEERLCIWQINLKRNKCEVYSLNSESRVIGKNSSMKS